MHISRLLGLHASGCMRATLSVALNPYDVGKYRLRPSLKQTSSWTNEFVASLGCELRAADSPCAISDKYESVAEQSMPQSFHELLRHDPETGIVKNINQWLRRINGQGSEAAVDRYVANVLHGCDLASDTSTELLEQEQLEFSLGSLDVTCIPDHLLRCGNPGDFTSRNTFVDIVTQESKVLNAKSLAWGQVVGELVAAAVNNRMNQPQLIPPPPVFGILVVGTRWTFLRAEFSAPYLSRLRDYTLLDSDHFPVYVWGGERDASGKVQQKGSRQWGLDYTDKEERRELMRMVVALSLEARDVTKTLATMS